jgi:hypothetical protein
MFRRRLSTFRVHIRGRGGSWLALLGQLIAVIGLPLPRASAKDLSKPFPCMHRACGCLSAEDCWKSCCCFSAGERVAWAREHEIEPPTALVEEAAREAVCCKRQCCSHGRGCCSEHNAKPTQKPGMAKSKSENSSRWLLVVQANRCKGFGAGISDSSAAAPPAPPIVWHFDWAPGGAVMAFQVVPFSLYPPPLLPPPRA